MMIARSGFIAMSGLFIIYSGLIAVGAIYASDFDENITRVNLLSGLASQTLGNVGAVFLSVLVALACFTTAVAIVVSIADFFKTYFGAYKNMYGITTLFCCLIGIGVGQMNVKYIIDVALPVLMFIYPLCIVLILLNVIPEKFASKLVFRWVVAIAFIFSIPDFLNTLGIGDFLKPISEWIPLSSQSLGWVIPAVIIFVLLNLFQRKINPAFTESSAS